MSDERCKWAGSDRPRILVDRHAEDCAGECDGCQPCERAHCRVCGMAHAAGTCAECLALVRESLHDIGRMCDSLPEEVEHRGIDGEAMVLLGPAADPEARGHLEASVAAGRVSADYLDAADGELHPLFVLATWQMVWVDALEHDLDEQATVLGAVRYLDTQMSYMAGYEHAPFEDFARDLRACRTHLERVLHDGEQVETGAPCMKCRVPLRREWGILAAADGWRCPRCTEWRSDKDYRLNVADIHREEADWLTDREMQLRTGVRAGTVREWARSRNDRPPLVSKRRDSGRTVYAVEDVERTAREKGMMSA